MGEEVKISTESWTNGGWIYQGTSVFNIQLVGRNLFHIQQNIPTVVVIMDSDNGCKYKICAQFIWTDLIIDTQLLCGIGGLIEYVVIEGECYQHDWEVDCSNPRVFKFVFCSWLSGDFIQHCYPNKKNGWG